MSANIIKKPFFAWPLLVIAVIAVSSAGAVLQEMSAIPPFLRASWRMYATSIVLLPGLFFQWTNKELDKPNRRDWLLIFYSSIFLAIHFGSWIWSLDNTSLVRSLLFVTSHPLVVVSIMPIIGIKVKKAHIIGATIGFFGAVISLGDIGSIGQASLAGDAAAFFGAISVVGYLFIGKYLRTDREIPVFIYALPVTFVAGLILTISSICLEGTSIYSTIPEKSAFGWLDAMWLPWIAFLAFGPGLMGHTGINTLLKWVSPIVVSISLLFEPVIGGIVGWFFTNELILGKYTTIGGLLMITGAIIITLEENSENPD